MRIFKNLTFLFSLIYIIINFLAKTLAYCKWLALSLKPRLAFMALKLHRPFIALPKKVNKKS
jgi:hypothetical protein